MSHPIVELLELEVMDAKNNSNSSPFYFELESDSEWSSSIFNNQSLEEISNNLNDSITTSINELIRLTENDSSIQRLLPSKKELAIQSKIDNNFAQSKAVNDLWVVRSGIQEIDVLIELGELGQALTSLDSVRSRLDAFGKSYQETSLVNDVVKKHINDILTTIKQKLEQGWKNAIVFEEKVEDDEQVSILTVNQTVDDLSLEVIFETVQLIDKNDGRINSLLESIEKHIINPILELNIKSVDVSDHTLKLVKNTDRIKLTVYDIIDTLGESIKFLQTSFEPPLLSTVISKRFASYIIQELSNHTLPELFPNDSSQLVLFKRELSFVNEFERLLIDLKWINNQDLSNWVNDFKNEWISYRKSIYLDKLRTIVFEDVKLERYGEEESSEWNWNEKDDEKENDDGDDDGDDDAWGWGDEDTKPAPTSVSKSKPSSQVSLTTTTITSTVNILINLIADFTEEVESQSSSLSSHISDLLDLYRSLFPLLYQDLPLIISYNDLIALTALLSNHVDTNDIENLTHLANNQLSKILQENQSKLLSVLSTANRFIDCTGNNQKHCEQAVSNVMTLMRSLGEELKTYTSYPVTVQLLGSILETAIVSLIESVEHHVDISEDESIELSKIITTITTLEDIFENPGVERKENQSFAAFYVPSWIKFQYLNEILQSKLVDITFMFNSNALVDFTSNELISLIKALFVDSEYRRRAIEEIGG